VLAGAVAERDYAKALAHLSALRDDVDQFFDSVLVNAENTAVRLNRLALLKDLRGQFLQVADLAVLAR
jgi:glycyl-tRNA synthetase beta chain